MSTEKLTIDGLERWVSAGAQWRVIDISRERVVVELCTCMGEPVDRLESADPDLIAYLRTARSDLDVEDPIKADHRPKPRGEATGTRASGGGWARSQRSAPG